MRELQVHESATATSGTPVAAPRRGLRAMWEPCLGVRSLLPVACVVAGAALLGWVLSLATTRVKNWFVMPDEMYYERLAVSVAQTGSLLPRLQDELVGNVNQLYPVLLSFVFGDGNVPASLADAHRLNAFLMT
jgi:hypothetical protein